VSYDAPVYRLYPDGGAHRALRNLYLDLPLEPSGWHGELFVYSNFVTSLDGRIALNVPRSGGSGVPPQTANPRDWRLFQELAGRADVLITSGRYLRQLARGSAQDVLPIGANRDFADIRHWRHERGMVEQPDVAVVSASLEFEIPAMLTASRERLLVLTGTRAPEPRKRALRDSGCQVLECDEGIAVTGAGVARALAGAGYRRAFSVAGPQILHLLAADGILDTLFLTLALRLLGGRDYDSILEGDLLPEPASFSLRGLYHDPHAPDGAAQLLGCFDRC
jgi:riboflavin biosynthesis pyrimidine reductase